MILDGLEFGVGLVRSMEVPWRFYVDGVSRSSVHVVVRVLKLARLRFDMLLIAAYQSLSLIKVWGKRTSRRQVSGKKRNIAQHYYQSRPRFIKGHTDPAKAEIKYREALHPNAYPSATHS